MAENEEISSSPPCGFLIGIYIIYENCSNETFRKKGWRKGGWLVHLQVHRHWQLKLLRTYRRNTHDVNNQQGLIGAGPYSLISQKVLHQAK
jgi:hypothetical protein